MSWPATPVTAEELGRARREFASVKERLDNTEVMPMVVRLQLESEKRCLEQRCEWLIIRWIAQGCRERT